MYFLNFTCHCYFFYNKDMKCEADQNVLNDNLRNVYFNSLLIKEKNEYTMGKKFWPFMAASSIYLFSLAKWQK